MPFIHITSLPQDEGFETEATVRAVSELFAHGTGIGLEHISVTWRYLEPGHYAHAGQTTDMQQRDSHPILVDILAPDFNDAETVTRMLECTAEAIAECTGVSISNVFVAYRAAHAGRVFDGGEVMDW